MGNSKIILIIVVFIVIVGAGLLVYQNSLETQLEPTPDNNGVFVPPTLNPEEFTSITLGSSAFADLQSLPVEYTCDGAGKIPPLSINGVPEETKSLALIVHDANAPGGEFVHLVLWNIDPTTANINSGELPEGVIGKNDFDDLDYGPPCPAEETGLHNYYYSIFALSEKLELEEGSSRDDLFAAMSGLVIDQDFIIGTYEK